MQRVKDIFGSKIVAQNTCKIKAHKSTSIISVFLTYLWMHLMMRNFYMRVNVAIYFIF
jgi:hypothetical protein